MSRRRRGTRSVDAGHGTARERAEYRKTIAYADLLRRFQLTSAVVMLLGVTAVMVILVGEFKRYWVVAAGSAVFVLGLLLFGLARPLARWWTR